ncbi:hypothetical protein [Zavarzinella formosa]|nr:hypothetical protein [Zavarzinella formosa]
MANIVPGKLLKRLIAKRCDPDLLVRPGRLADERAAPDALGITD